MSDRDDETTTPPPAGARARRPYDPAGTRPKHEAADLLPATREPLPAPGTPGPGEADVVDGDLAAEPDAGGDGVTCAGAGEGGDGSGRGGGDSSPPADEHLLPIPRVPAGVGPVAAAALPPRAANRMRLVLAALLAIAAAGVATAVLLTVHRNDPGPPPGPAWSAWQPGGSAGARVAVIADRVGREYRGSKGQQLVVVTGGPMEVAGLPLTVALREPPTAGGDVRLEPGKGVLYRLCGLGDKCAIPTGAPSVQRHLLLRREALELALYTLHYTDADQVVVFMPPPKGKSSHEALFFRRPDLQAQLQRPLAGSLVPSTPSVASVTRSPDTPFVQDLTLRTLFTFTLTQGNSDAQAFLVLDPLTGTS